MSNQGVGARSSDHYSEWEGLNFRSVTEVRIAQALDKQGVLYLPNCRARLGNPDNRKNLEPDFLICCEGNWGILEVDGQPYHSGLAARDHERDRVFKTNYHILVIERYSANKCYNDADGVVQEFLSILRNA